MTKINSKQHITKNGVVKKNPKNSKKKIDRKKKIDNFLKEIDEIIAYKYERLDEPKDEYRLKMMEDEITELESLKEQTLEEYDDYISGNVDMNFDKLIEEYGW